MTENLHFFYYVMPYDLVINFNNLMQPQGVYYLRWVLKINNFVMAGCHLELVERLPSLHSNFKGDYSLSHSSKSIASLRSNAFI